MALRRYFGKISPLTINQLVGHNGELVIDETSDKVYIMDGITPGGREIANAQANLNLEFTNVNPAVDAAYTLGSANFRWSNVFISNAINPNQTTNNLTIFAVPIIFKSILLDILISCIFIGLESPAIWIKCVNFLFLTYLFI